MSNKNGLINKPYISIGDFPHDAGNTENRRAMVWNEHMRIYYSNDVKNYFMQVRQKKNQMSFIGTALECVYLINKKYPADKMIRLQFNYGPDLPKKKKAKIAELMKQVDYEEKLIGKILLSYLLLLI